MSSWKAAQNALDVARVSRWSEPSQLEKDIIRIDANFQLRAARSAATAAKWLGGVRCFLGIVGGIAFVASVASAFLPSQPDPQIIESLNIIQAVTNETLARVKDVQVSLAAVSSELNRIETLIASLSCDVATDLIKGDVANIKSFWTLYYGDPDPNDPSAMQPTRSSYAGQVLNALALNPQFPYTINAALLRRVDEWADQVVNAGTGIEPHILNIYQGLGSEGGTGVIQRCGSKFADAIKNASPLPFDDRAYYQPLMQLVAVSDRVCVKKTSAFSTTHKKSTPPLFLEPPVLCIVAGAWPADDPRGLPLESNEALRPTAQHRHCEHVWWHAHRKLCRLEAARNVGRAVRDCNRFAGQLDVAHTSCQTGAPGEEDRVKRPRTRQ